jgi:hypothetical protein
MATYWELLRHPNWQRKRLEIMERANFTCELCGAKEDTLSVHHTYYEKGVKPWEYPSESLQCLCESCHRSAQDWMTLLNRQIGKVPNYIEEIYGVALGLEMATAPQKPVDVLSFQVAVGIARVFGTNANFIIALCRDGIVDGDTIVDNVYFKRAVAD